MSDKLTTNDDRQSKRPSIEHGEDYLPDRPTIGEWTAEGLKAIYANCNSWWEVAEAVNATPDWIVPLLDSDTKLIKALGNRLTEAQEQIRVTYGDLQYYVARSDELFRKLTVAKAATRELADELNLTTTKLATERHDAAEATKPLVDALEQIESNQLNDDNCASVELAGKRCANIARAALSQLNQTKTPKEPEQETVIEIDDDGTVREPFDQPNPHYKP